MSVITKRARNAYLVGYTDLKCYLRKYTANYKTVWQVNDNDNNNNNIAIIIITTRVATW